MLTQHEAGMLLCLCSKNNERDVHEVLAQRPEMLLHLDHFTANRINWRPKSENLNSLAQELRLGLDSFIFVDDDARECAEVQAACPEVLVLQLPDDPERIPQFLEHCWAFDHPKGTAEDRRRAELYRQNRDREQLRAESLSLADFLAGLDLKVQIEPMTAAQVPRVSQLTLRTNQFNCTTCRRTEAEIHQLPGTSEVLTVSVSDRFGDYGLVGVLIFEVTAKGLGVDTFLLSCRALGRGVEHQMLARLGQLAQERHLQRVDVHFTPTQRNKPALDFLESVGSAYRQPQNGGSLFRFPAALAANTIFEPRTADPSNAPRSTLHAPRSTLHAPRSTPYRDIALLANDLAAIQQEIESAAPAAKRQSAHCTAPRTDTERQLCELWQNVLRIERVGIQDDFFELDGTSLLAVRLMAEIEKAMGRKLPLVTLFQAPTIEQLAKALAPDKRECSQSLLVPIQPNGTRPPLFLVHGAGGDVLWGYANLAAYLGQDQPIYGIKSRGQAGLPEFSDLKEMAGCYINELRSLQPAGPYLLGGYCFGGNVAYEMARQLRARGESVALVLLLDSSPANAGYETMPWWRPSFAWRFARNLGYWLRDFVRLERQDRRSFVARKLGVLRRKLQRRLRSQADPKEVDIEDVVDPKYFSESELNLWKIHLQAVATHVDEAYPGRVTLLRTYGQPLFCSQAEDFCWTKLARGGVTVRRIPGSHESIFVEPHVRALASQVLACLREAQQVAVGEVEYVN
jgi:FkbH-like protein